MYFVRSSFLMTSQQADSAAFFCLERDRYLLKLMDSTTITMTNTTIVIISSIVVVLAGDWITT